MGYHGGSEWLSRGPSTACTTGRNQATPRSGTRNSYFRYLRTWHRYLVVQAGTDAHYDDALARQWF